MLGYNRCLLFLASYLTAPLSKQRLFRKAIVIKSYDNQKCLLEKERKKGRIDRLGRLNRLSKKTIAIVLVVMVVAVIAGAIVWRRTRTPPPPPTPTPTVGFLFMDAYEDAPTFRKTTPELWRRLTDDSKAGDYWCDQEHWLEIGNIVEGGGYRIDNPDLGDAKVVEWISHGGNKAVESIIYEVPSGYLQSQTCVARYLRDPAVVRDGVYEVGAWFYVPKGHTPYYVHVAMENHLSWTKGYFAHFGVNPENGELVHAVNVGGVPQLRVIGKVDFQYDTWFKLWIIYDTRELTKYTAGYKSTVEEKTFEIDEVFIAGPDPAYQDLPGFNFYATGHNLPGRTEQKLYVDDFYAKVVAE